MPLVVFESSGGGVVETDAPDGGCLVDLCDDHQAPVPFSCRSASCGTCRVDVLEGAEFLEPAHVDELEVLDLFGDDPARCRLACQARVRGGRGRLRIRAADP
jgi:2Fe-2S ferredoxin